MNVTFYTNFTKRRNSTLRPSGGTVHDVKLKERCSLLQPVFIFQGQHFNYNFCLWNNRYYFVTDAEPIANNLYEITCNVDVLATYRPQIGAYTAYIERASSAYDTDVIDMLLTQEQLVVAGDSVNHSIDAVTQYSNGTFIVPVFTHSGTILYAFNDLEVMSSFCNGSLMIYAGNNIGQNLEALVSTIGMNVFDIDDYIGNVMWVPFALSDIAELDTDTNLHFGPYDVGKGGNVFYRITSPYKFKHIDLGSLTNLYSDFRKFDPRFSRYTLLLPGVGLVPINALDGGRDDLILNVHIDFFTGSIVYRLCVMTAGGGTPVNYEIATFSGRIAVNVPLSQSTGNPDSFLAGVIGVAAGIATENYAMAAGSAMSAIGAITEQQPQLYGSNGNIPFALRNYTVRFSVTNYGSKEFILTEAGRPLCENRQISTLSGFIKCGNAAVPIAGFESEKTELNNMLNSGFYYE